MTTQSTTFPETNLSSGRIASADGRSTGATIEASTSELTGKLRQMVESGKLRVTEWKGGIQEGIREKPIQSILIATAVGAVIGLVIGRQSR